MTSRLCLPSFFFKAQSPRPTFAAGSRPYVRDGHPGAPQTLSVQDWVEPTFLFLENWSGRGRPQRVTRIDDQQPSALLVSGSLAGPRRYQRTFRTRAVATASMPLPICLRITPGRLRVLESMETSVRDGGSNRACSERRWPVQGKLFGRCRTRGFKPFVGLQVLPWRGDSPTRKESRTLPPNVVSVPPPHLPRHDGGRRRSRLRQH